MTRGPYQSALRGEAGATKETIQFETVDDEGCVVEHELPARFGVCSDCEGHGTTLRAGMREHAYTQEEFNETFHDDEDRAEYFKRGGMYDETCRTCEGKRVVLVVDRERCCWSDEHKQALALYEAKLKDEAAYERECAAERRAGC